MCLIIFKNPGVPIPKIFLERAARWNPHGFGFAYSFENQLIQQKGYFMLDPFIAALKKIPKTAKAIIHLRNSSGGLINAENCHPFSINQNYTMVHNGMIPNFGDMVESDTSHFTREILKPLFDKLGMIEGFQDEGKNYFLRYLIAGAINGGKIIILRRDGEHLIVGAKQGLWIKGIWYSNKKSITPFVPPKPDEKIIGFNIFKKLPDLKNLKLIPKVVPINLPNASSRGINLSSDLNLPTVGEIVSSAQ